MSASSIAAQRRERADARAAAIVGSARTSPVPSEHSHVPDSQAPAPAPAAGDSVAADLWSQVASPRESTLAGSSRAPDDDMPTDGTQPKPMRAADALRLFEEAQRARREAAAGGGGGSRVDPFPPSAAAASSSASDAATDAAIALAMGDDAYSLIPSSSPAEPVTEDQARLLLEAAARHAEAAARRDAAMGHRVRHQAVESAVAPETAPVVAAANGGMLSAFVTNPTSYAEASRAIAALLAKADETAAEAAAAEAAQDAAANEKAEKLEGGKKKASIATRIVRSVFGGPSGSPIHPWKECPICLELLGTEGNAVQALGCMDAFCRECIATHLDCQAEKGQPMSCPICKREVPEEERNECGESKVLPVKNDQPSVSAASAAGAGGGGGGGGSSAAAPAARPARAPRPPRNTSSAPVDRRPLGQRLATAAVTTAAAMRHAPQLLRSSPEALAAAATALARSNANAGGRRGGGDELEEDSDGDMIFLADGDVVTLDMLVTDDD